MKKLQSVILDMDGVISDSEPLHVAAERKTLLSFGVEVSLEDLQVFLGKGIEYMLETFIRSYSLDISYKALYELHQKNLIDAFRQGVKPIDGILELIHHMAKNNVSLAVASSSSSRIIQLVLEQFKITSFFHAVVSGDEVENGKPAPDIFIEALRRMECPADSGVVIEDSPSGVAAAKRAGIKCVGFKSPNSGNQDLSEADWITDDLGVLNVQTLESLLLD